MRPVLAVAASPVVQPDEVKAIVDKTITYLRSPSYGEWRRDTMFITDESDYFKQSSDQIVAALGNQGFVADRVCTSPQKGQPGAPGGVRTDSTRAGCWCTSSATAAATSGAPDHPTCARTTICSASMTWPICPTAGVCPRCCR